MSTPASALGALAGASGGISAISNLIMGGNTGKGKTTVHAESEADVASKENITGKESIRGTESGTSSSVTDAMKNIDTSTSSNKRASEFTSGTETTSGQETSKARSTSKGTSEALETFSGQKNVTEQQTMLDVPATMRIINLMLQGDAGIKGLQEVAGGERTAGVYDSSTNQLLLNNLLATVGGEVARISAPVVKKEALGETSTKQQMSKEELTDALTEAFSNMSRAFGTSTTQDITERTSSRSAENLAQTVADIMGKATTTDATSELLKALEQTQTQTMDSKTKTKSKSGLLGLF